MCPRGYTLAFAQVALEYAALVGEIAGESAEHRESQRVSSHCHSLFLFFHHSRLFQSSKPCFDVCVCVCVCGHVCAYVHCLHVYMHACTHTLAHLDIHTHTHTHTHTYTHTHTHLNTLTHMHTPSCVHAPTSLSPPPLVRWPHGRFRR